MFRFFRSVGTEMKNVDWPNGRQLRRDSTTVIGTSLFFIVFLAIVDWLVQLFLKLFV
ncbi:preprotein translocase subunit SecE [Pediococcus claussenii]|uniref:Preprotein translocase, SecE subunit n=1 Tax=Pediococcus claussenii (strain ATCC BAA-344 / DSM 14800 / JCM 18046 / KCTC 3811 / LMG 21948 / P06) TaxID=701521 RepID=G8PBM3_PEDCP|nr:preprotein translocase subunit SecE [Pediococcus claussenii]AEV94772.1 preprotein translocase, SecE subunit [Pediococcus claussenii ATCC BAA-344]